MNRITENIFKRLKDIDDKLSRRNYVSSSELAKKLNVSVKTILRDIKYLKSEYDAPVEYDFERRSFHYTNKDFKLEPFKLSAVEFYNLAVIFELLKSYDHNPYKSGQKSLLKKIRLNYADEINRQISDVKEKLSFRFSPVKKYNVKRFKKIENALINERTIEIRYIKSDTGNEMKRTIDPYHLRNYNGDWYLIGYEHERKKIRVSSVDRIADVRLTNRYFDVPDDFNVNEYFKFSFGKRRTSKHVMYLSNLFGKRIFEKRNGIAMSAHDKWQMPLPLITHSSFPR